MSQHTIYHPTLDANLTGILDQSGTVVRYRGLQYATVRERWTRSELSHPADRDIDATKFGCPQPEEPNHTVDFGPYLAFEHAGQDDKECLNLNVTCPKNVKGLLPVFFWIHGGALYWGAGSDPMWEPTPLVKQSIDAGTPIVVVTINYRLGPFGFLAPRDVSDRTVQLGNFGFHDQVNALEWCQRHISGFQGDPTRVTIGGESAGGCSTHAQIAHQETLGNSRYFKRAVLHSGNFAVMGFWDRQRMDQCWENAIAELRLEQDDNPLEAMRGLHWQRLLYIEAFKVRGYGVYMDGVFMSSPSFGPDGRFRDQRLSTVDAVMHGDNAHEGNIFRAWAAEPTILQILRSKAADILGEKGRDELLNIYGLDKPDDISRTELVHRITAIPEDARFYLPSDELCRIWPAAAFYHLTPRSPFSTSRFPDDCFHTQDLLYLFGDFDHLLEAEGKADHLRVGLEIKSTWLRFIYGRDPWKGAFEAVAATFGIEGVRHGSVSGARQWSNERLVRLKRLEKLDPMKLLECATRIFP